jgi:hypothetical protein
LLNGGFAILKKQHLQTEWIGPENLGNHSAIHIRLIFSPGVVRELYFDTHSHLLVRDVIPAHGDSASTEIDFSDYRPVEGLLEPFVIEQRHGADAFRTTVTIVTLNASVPDSIFQFPSASNATPPDAASLFRAVEKNQEQIDQLVKNYIYKETDKDEENDPDDKGEATAKSVKEYEVFYISGKEIRRLITKDGKELNPEDRKKEDGRVDREIEERKRQQAKETEVSRQKEQDEERAQISMFLRLERFFNPRREIFRGQEVIVFDFEGNPKCKPKGPVEKFVHSLAGSVWIDPQAKDVARLEASLHSSVKFGGGLFASVQKDSGFVFEQQLVNDDVWLPSYSEAHFSGRVLLVKGFKENEVDRFSDYRTFTVQARIVPVPPVPATPVASSTIPPR